MKKPLAFLAACLLGLAASQAAPFKVAAVEFNPEFFEFEQNIPRIVAIVEEAAKAGAKIIVLPETATSGYIYKGRKQFDPFLDTVPGKTTDALAKVTAEHDCYVTIGLAEIDRSTGLAYNTGALAEPLDGPTAQNPSTLANQNAAHVVGSFIEQADGKLFATAMLVGPDGKTLGTYRKTHLEESERDWATAGDELAVFPTAIGRIGPLLGGDARFPEASGVLSVKRTDILAIPSAWRGQYGTQLQISPALFAERYPENTMALWYAIAKTAQAHTLVANFVGDGFLGSSGHFTLNPVDANDPPVTASSDSEETLAVDFTTLADPRWWMSQQNLITGRRVDLLAPLTFPLDSEVFKKWKSTPGFDLSLWEQFRL
jgi:predicted amidohydrolase